MLNWNNTLLESLYDCRCIIGSNAQKVIFAKMHTILLELLDETGEMGFDICINRERIL